MQCWIRPPDKPGRFSSLVAANRPRVLLTDAAGPTAVPGQPSPPSRLTRNELAGGLQQARQAKGRHTGGRHARHCVRHRGARLATDLWVLVRVGVRQQQRQQLRWLQAGNHDLPAQAGDQGEEERAG